VRLHYVAVPTRPRARQRSAAVPLHAAAPVVACVYPTVVSGAAGAAVEVVLPADGGRAPCSCICIAGPGALKVKTEGMV
jgi:hypothetical protein